MTIWAWYFFYLYFFAGADLFLCDRCDQTCDSYSNLPHSYAAADEKPVSASSLMGDYNFLVEEYEVHTIRL